jgi:hypothetical protein
VPRRPHPDDVLKRLARNGRGATGPEIYVGQSRPFDRVRAGFFTLFGLLLLFGGVTALPFVLPHHEIRVVGIDPRAFLTPDGLRGSEVFFSTKPASGIRSIRVRIDGEPAVVVVEGERLRWIPPALAEGRHRLTLQSGSRFLWRGPSRKTVSVEIDSVSPTMTVAGPSGAVTIDGPLTIKGTVEKDAKVTVNDKQVPIVDGAFSRRFELPPIGLVRIDATDRAGNITHVEQPVGVAYPQVQGVHVSALAWVTPKLHDPILRLASDGRINTVMLDLKDESGHVGYRSSLTRVNDIGANIIAPGVGQYDLRAAIAELHSHGIRVIGRIVAFRDPLLARSSINAGRLDEVVQTLTGGPYDSTYGAFANPASPAVQTYLLDLMREAADAGVDDIVFDYLRRPDGGLTLMHFPGITDVTPESISDVIIGFVRAAGKRLGGTKARLGVAVAGVAAKHPDRVAQDVRALARIVDFISPIVYPSQWASGSYGIVDPANSPYEIVTSSVREFHSQMAGTDAALLPWLQDFTLAPGRRYGAAEVRAQILASREQSATGFVVWDPKVTYNEVAIPNDASALSLPKVTGGSGVAPTVPATVSAVVPVAVVASLALVEVRR